MSHDLNKRLDSLENRLARLEFREGYAQQLLDQDKDRWSHFVLESDMNGDQVTGIVALMNYAHDTITEGAMPISPDDFEKRAGQHRPRKYQHDTYTFAKSVLIAWAMNSQFLDVYSHLREGLNLPKL